MYIIKEETKLFSFKSMSILIAIIGVLSIPYVLDKLIPLVNSNVGDNEIWLNFWAGWLGALVGAIVTIIGVNLTLKSSKKQFNRTLDENKIQYRETLETDRNRYEDDRRLSVMSHLKIYIDNKIEPMETMFFNGKGYEARRSNTIKKCMVRIKNIGLGSALNVKFKIGDFIGENRMISENITFDLGANESFDCTLMLHKYDKDNYVFKLTYTDILNEYEYEQKGRLFIKEQGVRAIKNEDKKHAKVK